MSYTGPARFDYDNQRTVSILGPWAFLANVAAPIVEARIVRLQKGAS